MADYYQQLLDIEEKQGYVMIIQFGQSYENGRLVSPVGMNVKAQDFYAELRDIVKSSFPVQWDRSCQSYSNRGSVCTV